LRAAAAAKYGAKTMSVLANRFECRVCFFNLSTLQRNNIRILAQQIFEILGLLRLLPDRNVDAAIQEPINQTALC
jgi:hypothetical protein